MLSLAILGHHTGLPDRSEARASLLSADKDSTACAKELLKTLDWSEDRLVLPAWASSNIECELLVRMLFSCLVDADYLDTEAHFEGRRRQSGSGSASLKAMAQNLSQHLASLNPVQSKINSHRASILKSSLDSASFKPGFFSLQVPTGGGKTFSGLAFALNHAEAHGMDRVIAAIPYTSIIDQTASIYKGIFGEENVLEHHSGLESKDESEDCGPLEARRRLLCENWDAPLIVTTTVQLFESLHSNRPSRCRRLHNISRSVIILDEVQALPTELLGPILEILKSLVSHYGCTVVFCTATLPDFGELIPSLRESVRPIVPDFLSHYQAMRRVRFEASGLSMDHSGVSDEIQNSRSVLAVFNSRKDAAKTFQFCREKELGGLKHLSSLMNGHHRRKVIREVKDELRDGQDVRLISTQVVEAGVDLSFPLVLRAMGPLDRIIQAAGRCNREGEEESGVCKVFELLGGSSPKGSYGAATQVTRTLIEEFGGNLDHPDVVAQYSRELFRHTETGTLNSKDRGDVLRLRSEFEFRQVAAIFRMIDQDTVPVLPAKYPFYSVMQLLDGWDRSPGSWLRKIAPFTVSVYRHELAMMVKDGLIEEHESGLHLYSGVYDESLGLTKEFSDPAELVV